MSGTIADTSGKSFADVRAPIALVNPWIELTEADARKFWAGATRNTPDGRPQIQIDTYSYFSLWQGGKQVYGSGIAVQNTWVDLTAFRNPIKGKDQTQRIQLVAFDQIQPDGRKSPELAAYPYGAPAVSATPICNGGPPVPTIQGGVLGEGTISVYGRFTTADGDGTASPSCSGRVPIMFYWGKMRWDFVLPGPSDEG